MDFYNRWATNAIHEAQGKPFTKEFGGKCSLLIARSNNPAYTRMLAEQFDIHKEVLEDKSSQAAKDAAQALNDKVVIFIMARTILLNWTGDVKYQGNNLPYSVENAELLLALPEFRNKVAGLAGDFNNYRMVQEAADEKNSAPTSNGASPGAPGSSPSA